jgi:hypothetical protein
MYLSGVGGEGSTRGAGGGRLRRAARGGWSESGARREARESMSEAIDGLGFEREERRVAWARFR